MGFKDFKDLRSLNGRHKPLRPIRAFKALEAVSHRFQDRGKQKNRSHQTFLDERGPGGLLLAFPGSSWTPPGPSWPLLGGLPSWTPTDEKLPHGDMQKKY